LISEEKKRNTTELLYKKKVSPLERQKMGERESQKKDARKGEIGH